MEEGAIRTARGLEGAGERLLFKLRLPDPIRDRLTYAGNRQRTASPGFFNGGET